jgi:predicted  nucleic acid-binding Zn-ribbon protein
MPPAVCLNAFPLLTSAADFRQKKARTDEPAGASNNDAEKIKALEAEINDLEGKAAMLEAEIKSWEELLKIQETLVKHDGKLFGEDATAPISNKNADAL